MKFEEISKELTAAHEGKGGVQVADYEGYQDNIEKALLYFIDAMFPNYVKRPAALVEGQNPKTYYLQLAYTHLLAALKKRIIEKDARKAADSLLEAIPSVYELLKTDVQAGYEGDPAAKSVDEVILAYPAFIAISAHRIAHELYMRDCTMEARMMSEYAHRKTGIDIHPGATIGKRFFIDHGTGVVIGETCVIGENVKLYQHVTLGAKSFPVNDDGTLVKGIKRHPNIGNNVVVYSGATILGGDVFIGDGCVIGGNVWLTHSVEPGQMVKQKSADCSK